jgi:hypothetical protein
MTTDLNEAEVTLLIQLLNQRIVEIQRDGNLTPTPAESALITRLLSERTAFIISQRAKGLPVG